MRFKWTVLLMMIGWAGTGQAGATVLRDSLRVEMQDGLRYVIHKVDAGETLYGLSRRYGISQADLVKANPEVAQAGLKVNQNLRIPLGNAPQPVVAKGTVHTVAPGETLFAISQMYDVAVADIKSWNNLTSNSLSIGQELVVNRQGSAAQPATTPRTNTAATPTGGKKHTVNASETLFGISRTYEVTVADLRIWNKLPDNTISIGQELWVSAPNEEEQETTTSPVVASTPTTTPRDTPASQSTQNNTTTPVANNTSQNTTQTTPNPVVSPNSSIPTRVGESVRNLGREEDEENSTGFKKIRENGMCEVIEGSGEPKKYLAMHATAPIGTIMEVRNEMNDLKVFVRVVARLPQTTSNENLVMKISQAAYERLGAADRRFPIEVTYIP